MVCTQADSDSMDGDPKIKVRCSHGAVVLITGRARVESGAWNASPVPSTAGVGLTGGGWPDMPPKYDVGVQDMPLHNTPP